MQTVKEMFVEHLVRKKGAALVDAKNIADQALRNITTVVPEKLVTKGQKICFIEQLKVILMLSLDMKYDIIVLDVGKQIGTVIRNMNFVQSTLSESIIIPTPFVDGSIIATNCNIRIDEIKKSSLYNKELIGLMVERQIVLN